MTEKNFCILIADDESTFRDLVKFHFSDLGYDVLEAEDGAKALEMFKESRDDVDLVITDIRMPKMDGETLIQELRQLDEHLPIIGITGHMDLQDALKMMAKGAYFYLHKPLDPWPMVERLVANAVSFRRYQRSVESSRRKELEIARLVRTYIVSTSMPVACKSSAGYRICLDVAAKPIDRRKPSGDFAEWFNLSLSEVCFSLSDSSGHDDLLPCFVACLCNMVLHRCHHGCRPGLDQVVTTIDQALGRLRERGALEMGKHLTFFLGRINLEHGELDYVSAGHPAAFLLRRAPGQEVAACQRLEQTARPVGFLFGQRPSVIREQLVPGDVLFVYSDGANELLQGNDRHGAGLDRLERILQPFLAGTAQEIVDRVEEELARVAGEDGFPDDTTLLAIKVLDAGD